MKRASVRPLSVAIAFTIVISVAIIALTPAMTGSLQYALALLSGEPVPGMSHEPDNGSRLLHRYGGYDPESPPTRKPSP